MICDTVLQALVMTCKMFGNHINVQKAKLLNNLGCATYGCGKENKACVNYFLHAIQYSTRLISII